MNHIRRIRRLTGALAGLAGPCWRSPRPRRPPLPGPCHPHPPPGWPLRHHPLPPGHWTGPVDQVPAHTVATGGMPGWQTALIAAAAALAAVVVAVLLDRARAAPVDDHGGRLGDARTQAIRVIPRPDDPRRPRTSPAPPARQQTPIQRSR